MAQFSWEKPKNQDKANRSERPKFLSAGIIVLVAVLYLLVAGTLQGARYFITVEELLTAAAYSERAVRVTGAVDGATIEYDSENARIRFEIAHIPSEVDDLAAALHAALQDSNAPRLRVLVPDSALPDLLQHEAQAILTGKLNGDGLFVASEIFLKCPSRFEESVAPGALSQIPEHQ